MTQEEAELPTLQQYSHSLKITDVAGGVRFTVHVHANSTDDVIDQGFAVYVGAMERASNEHIPMADSNGEIIK